MVGRAVEADATAGDDLIAAWDGGVLRPVEKLEVHRRGLRHKAISVFVIAGGDTLLQRRALGKYHTPGLWSNACCTHPRWREPAEACASRRLFEELGIPGEGLVHRGRVVYRAPVGGGLTEHEEVEIFTLDVSSRIAVEANPEEVADIRWLSFEDLLGEVRARPEDFTPWLAIYLERHSPLFQRT
jgi:isopentenyl-diphosphate delta-isomerase